MTVLANLVDDEIEAHFDQLGFGSVTAYKLWCYRNGLSGDLEKSADEREAEIDLHKGQTEPEDEGVSRLHSPRRDEWIARIFQGEHQNETLTDLLFRMRTMYNNLADDAPSHQALCRLLLHVEKYGDLMRPAKASKCYGDLVTNTHLGGMEQLARNHEDWIRPVEEGGPTTTEQDVNSGLLPDICWPNTMSPGIWIMLSYRDHRRNLSSNRIGSSI